jgi:hypothetical protein
VDHGAQVRVVVIVRRGGRAIDERILAGEGAPDDVDGRILAPREDAARDIQDGAPAVGADVRGNVLPA